MRLDRLRRHPSTSVGQSDWWCGQGDALRCRRSFQRPSHHYCCSTVQHESSAGSSIPSMRVSGHFGCLSCQRKGRRMRATRFLARSNSACNGEIRKAQLRHFSGQFSEIGIVKRFRNGTQFRTFSSRIFAVYPDLLMFASSVPGR